MLVSCWINRWKNGQGIFHLVWLVSQLWPFQGRKDHAKVVHALIIFKLDVCCNVLNMGLPLKTSWKLQLIKHIPAGVLIEEGCRDDIILVLFY